MNVVADRIKRRIVDSTMLGVCVRMHPPPLYVSKPFNEIYALYYTVGFGHTRENTDAESVVKLKLRGWILDVHSNNLSRMYCYVNAGGTMDGWYGSGKETIWRSIERMTTIGYRLAMFNRMVKEDG